MGFNMKGSPAKMGTIRGTAGHRSALKNMKTGKYAHSFEDDRKQTPAYLKSFGIGKGTSPSPLDFDATGKSEAEIKTQQEALGVASDGIWGPKSQAAADAAAEKKNNKEVKAETDGDAITENIVKPPKVNKTKTIASKIGNTLVGAFTSGLDAVYGQGKVIPGDKLKFHNPKKKKEEKEFGTTALDNDEK
tara:strand:+ start:207 stop:776 length:570 start_codon:yes stop_codon:yes gene_type:complete